MTRRSKTTPAKQEVAPEADDGYRIGKGQPPRDFCFRKGVSGNPNGRPKGSRNLSTVMKGILNTRIDTVKNSKRAKVTVKEAAGLKLAKKALDGDYRSIVEVLRYAETLDQESAATASHTTAADADIVNVFAERVRSGAFGAPNEATSPDADQAEEDAP